MAMDPPERFEQLIAFISSQLPKPVEEHHVADGSILFSGGEPPEVLVHLKESTVVVAAFSFALDEGEHGPAMTQDVGELHWHNLPETPLMNALTALIKGARDVRLSTYRACLECSESVPPEDLDSNGLCSGCAGHVSETIH